MTHATTADLEAFVTSGLDEERSAWLEQHCEECERCAGAVADEARLELTLRSVSADLRCGMRADVIEPVSFAAPAPAPKPRLYAFAAAAALTFVFAAIGHVPQTQAQRPTAVFADAGDLASAQPSSPAWAVGEPSGGTP